MINTANKCDGCNGIVRNIPGKRHTMDRLTEIHNRTCPGLHRRKNR